MLSPREGHPSLQRPHRPARPHRRSRRPRQQPALVLAPADPRPLPEHRPEALGQGAQGPGPPALRALRRRSSPASRPTTSSSSAVTAAKEDLRHLPHRAALVPGLGRAGRGRRPQGDRLLQPRVRHHRGAAAVLRRSRHPRRRPPQDGLRPRRADRRRRPVLQDRVLQAVASTATAGSRRPTPSSTRTDCRSPCSARTTAAPASSPSTCPAAASCTPTCGGPRSAGCRCCCSTPTSRTTTRPPAT